MMKTIIKIGAGLTLLVLTLILSLIKNKIFLYIITSLLCKVGDISPILEEFLNNLQESWLYSNMDSGGRNSPVFSEGNGQSAEEILGIIGKSNIGSNSPVFSEGNGESLEEILGNRNKIIIDSNSPVFSEGNGQSAEEILGILNRSESSLIRINDTEVITINYNTTNSSMSTVNSNNDTEIITRNSNNDTEIITRRNSNNDTEIITINSNSNSNNSIITINSNSNNSIITIDSESDNSDQFIEPTLERSIDILFSTVSFNHYINFLKYKYGHYRVEDRYFNKIIQTIKYSIYIEQDGSFAINYGLYIPRRHGLRGWHIILYEELCGEIRLWLQGRDRY